MRFKAAGVGVNPEIRLRVFNVRLQQNVAMVFAALGTIAGAAGRQKIRPLECQERADRLGDVMLDLRIAADSQRGLTEGALAVGQFVECCAQQFLCALGCPVAPGFAGVDAPVTRRPASSVGRQLRRRREMAGRVDHGKRL